MEAKPMYLVATNMDRVAKIPSIGVLPWRSHFERMPNRVSLLFSDIESARRLYKALQAVNCFASKNWIDD